MSWFRADKIKIGLEREIKKKGINRVTQLEENYALAMVEQFLMHT